jgi:hypothetical protein
MKKTGPRAGLFYANVGPQGVLSEAICAEHLVFQSTSTRIPPRLGLPGGNLLSLLRQRK